MTNKPSFGPFDKWDNIKTFVELSDRSFSIFDEQINKNLTLLTRPVHHLFLRMAYQAKTTSYSSRLINSWVFCLPAFALTRVRLEQTIVCSYLIHEDDSVGLKPFVSYISVKEHKNLREAMEEPKLSKELSGMVDYQKSEEEAVKAQEQLTPGFILESGKFQRNWTNLDLRTMAKRRDTLVNKDDSLFQHSLEREYISIYKVASSIIHADCSSLSYSFLDLFPSPSGQPVLMAVPSWAIIVVASLSHYDLLQCYEILNWIGIDVKEEYSDLMKKWLIARDKYVK